MDDSQDARLFYRFTDVSSPNVSRRSNTPLNVGTKAYTDSPPSNPVTLTMTLLTRLLGISKHYGTRDETFRSSSFNNLPQYVEMKEFQVLTEELQVVRIPHEEEHQDTLMILAQVEIGELSADAKIAFWCNLYNVLALHARLARGGPALRKGTLQYNSKLK